MIGVSQLPGDSVEHAILWNETAATDLGALSGGTISQANDINNAGQIAGYSGSSDGDRAAPRSGGTVTGLATLSGTRAEVRMCPSWLLSTF